MTALGGAQNLTEVAACTTRLRLVLVDNRAIDEATLKRLGARGILRSSATGLQVVLGPIADQVAGEIRAALRSLARAAPFEHAPDASTRRLCWPRWAAATMSSISKPPRDRLLIRTARPDRVDESALAKLGIRGIARSAADSIQLLVAGPAEEWAEPLRRLL